MAYMVIDPVIISKLVTLAVAVLCVRYPEALHLPREHLRRLATEEVLAELRADRQSVRAQVPH